MATMSTSRSSSCETENEEARREDEIAKRVEGLFLGRDPRRILLANAPNTVEGILEYTTDRIEQAIRMLVELGFLEEPDWSKFVCVPDDDRRRSLAKEVIRGLRAYDKHRCSTSRFGWDGKAKEYWNKMNRVKL